MISTEKAWYTIDNIDQLDSPALVVYPDRVKSNIANAIAMVGDKDRLRPHIKTNKCREACELLLHAGIKKFKCATIAEAELLGICGAPDVLLAYQPTGPKINRLIALINKYPATRFSCLVDNERAAREISALAERVKIELAVWLDINVGMNRTGIQPGEAAAALYALCHELPGIVSMGLHAYDGHIRDSDFAVKTKNCDAAYSLVKDLQEKITASGFARPTIIMGGSPSFSVHCKRLDIECSPGTFIYWDRGYQVLCPEQPFLPAALVITRIISIPAPDRICTDLGHKSIAPENEIERRVYFLNAP